MKILKNKQSKETERRSTGRSSNQSAPVFSYYSNRSTDMGHSARHKSDDKKLNKDNSLWLRYAPSLISLAVVACSLFYMTTLSSNPRVTILADSSAPSVVQSSEVYQSASRKLLRRSFFNQSKLTIDTTSIADDLEKEFPELGAVVVTVPIFGRKPTIQAQPARPMLILSGNGGSYVIDTKGVPIFKAQHLKSSVRDSLPVILDGSDTSIELGKQILTADLVDFVTSLQEQFKVKNISIEEYSFPALPNELHVRIAGKGYYLKFNTEADARMQVGAYFALQEKLTADGITPDEYIDLRIEERAYYK